jgi:hypothetical protein
MESNGVLVDRTNKNNLVTKNTIEMNGNTSPKTRPIPQFFLEQTTFSTKKEKHTPKLIDIYPPKPPIKSCPPISRLKPFKKPEKDVARVISFAKVNNSPDLKPGTIKFYNNFLTNYKFL